jgi:membrane-associated protein
VGTNTLQERGGELITVARFIPGGRTAVTLTAGLTRFGWSRFARYDAAAAVVWAAYAALLGYFGGRAFEQEPWKGLLLALVIALIVTVGTEVGRGMANRKRAARQARPAEPDLHTTSRPRP